MKKLHLLLSFFIVFLFSDLTYSQSNPAFQNKFTLGAFNYYPFNPQFYNHPLNFHENNYKDLSFNLLEAHIDGNGDYDNNNFHGGFYDAIKDYRPNIASMLNAMENDFGVIGTIIMNERIFRGCYGQASKYQAEDAGTWNTRYPGYGYMGSDTGEDTTETWKGETVTGRAGLIGRDNPGYLVKQLYENMEQVNFNSDWFIYVSDVKFDWPNYKWYLRPRMRIDSNYAMNHLDDTVAIISIYNFNGDSIKSIYIKCENFLDDNGNYNGSYKETYRFQAAPNYPLSFIQGAELHPSHNEDQELSEVDYRVYWTGKCDLWLDYVGVYDEWAQFLFNPEFTDPGNSRTYDFQNKINWAVDSLSKYFNNFDYFYVDEFDYNMIPCIAKVNSLIKNRHSTTAVIPLFSQSPVGGYYWVSDALRNPPNQRDVITYLKSSGAITDIFMSEPYPFEDRIPLPPNVTKPNPADYPKTALYYNAPSNSVYNDSLNNFLERTRMHFFRDMAWATKNTNIMYSLLTQVHTYEQSFSNHNDTNHYILREPLHEEISLQNYLGFAYGAKQILYFIYQSIPLFTPPNYNWGLINYNGTKRMTNYYGLSKWDSLARLDSAILKMGQYMVDQKRLHYDATRSVNAEGLPFRYVQDIKSIYNRGSSPFDFPETDHFDPSNKLYWEIGFFDPDNTIEPNSYSKYFLAVNKRCAPEIPMYHGDSRELKIKFNTTGLPSFDNWKVIDAITNQTLGTFDINTNQYISVGSFMPGQGRLFKLAPVMEEGGTFIGNESFGNVIFNCKGNVNNGGYDLTIAANTVIDFDSAKKITLNGGNFTCGGVRESWSEADIGNDVVLTSLSSDTAKWWRGLEISNCNIVSIGGTKFEKVKGNSLYAINAYNCNTFRVRFNLFLSGVHNQKTGSVNFTFMPPEEVPAPPVIEITGNRIYHNNSNLPSINIASYSSGQTSALVRNNVLYGYSSDVGMLLSNITGGSVKSNTITNYVDGIVSATSYIDLYKNNIENITETSTGLSLNFGSVANLNFNLSIVYQNSGMNRIINRSSGARNIFVDNSYFTTKGGFNTFDAADGEVHFYGIFDDYYNGGKEDAEYNCFRIDGDDNSDFTDVDWYSGGDVTFATSPYVCTTPSEDDYDTVVYADGIIDTLWSYSGGLGGGYSDKQETISITSEPTQYELKTDSLNYFLRKRRFNEVKRIGNDLTNSFSDSDRVANIIQPLYFAAAVTDDTNHTNISALKTKLENLISNNPENNALVLRCNYFLQKCKVVLGQYSSALSGFYDIMQNYPYNWEGVVAGWDYSATQLISQGGAGQGYSHREHREKEEIKDNIIVEARRAEISYKPAGEFADEPYGDDPKGVKRTIEKTIEQTLTDTKDKTEKQIKVEEQQIKDLKIDVKNEKNIKQSKALEKKLQQKKIMSEVIKPRKPQTVIEHINFVNADIQKIYSGSSKTTDIEENISLPDKYSLSQNYPNPFNPVTKIKFELPQESKLTIIIYDILGRKVAQLINNELRVAGRYEVQFNGHNFASGIYFYRLVANAPGSGSGQVFIDTKRMVLIK